MAFFKKVRDSLLGTVDGELSSNPKGSSEQYRLGNHYYECNNFDQAVIWFEKAANQGHILAQRICGDAYSDPHGVFQFTETNFHQSLYWYEKAAEQGDGEAQYRCSILTSFALEYMNGWSKEEQNLPKSIKFLKQSAESGYAKAQFELGIRFSFDSEIGVNQTKVKFWVEEAANQGYIDAQVKLAEIYNDDFFFNIRKSSAVDSLKMAQYWANKAAEAGSEKGQLACVSYYHYHKAVDLDKAFFWADILLKKGNKEVKYTLASLYASLYFNGSVNNPEKAIYWYKESLIEGAEGCNTVFASLRLGEMYYGTEEFEQAKYWLGESLKYIEVETNIHRSFDDPMISDSKEKVIELLSLIDKRLKYTENKQSSDNILLIECPSCHKTIRIPKIEYPKKGNITCACQTKLSVRMGKHNTLHVNIRDAAPNEITSRKEALHLLKLNDDATTQEIIAAYKKLMSQYHPDKVEKLGDKLRKLAEEESKLINSAYGYLKA